MEKVAQYAPGSRVYVRLAVDNHGSVLPLAGKFGVSGDEALDLFDHGARAWACSPSACRSTSVRSVCRSINWVNAIKHVRRGLARSRSTRPRILFPGHWRRFPGGALSHDQSSPRLNEIGEVVDGAIERVHPATRPNLMLVLEPGRGLVGEFGRLLVTVVGKAQRGDDTWLYLDAGVFNGLMETYEGFPPVVQSAERPTMTARYGATRWPGQAAIAATWSRATCAAGNPHRRQAGVLRLRRVYQRVRGGLQRLPHPGLYPAECGSRASVGIISINCRDAMYRVRIKEAYQMVRPFILCIFFRIKQQDDPMWIALFVTY